MARIKSNNINYILVKDNMMIRKFVVEKALNIYVQENNIHDYKIIKEMLDNDRNIS